MKTLVALLCLLPFLLPLIACADEDLAAIDVKSGLMTVQQNGATKNYQLSSSTEITINGQKGTSEELRPGMRINVTLTNALADAKKVSMVAARGNISSRASQPPAATPASSADNKLKSLFGDATTTKPVRELVIKASIDGDDKFIIQNGKITIHHGGWDKLKNLSINDIPWKPDWTDKDSDEFSSVQLMPFAGAEVTVEKIKGRGETKLSEAPTEANGQKLVIHLKDPSNGASDYEVHVRW